MLMVAFGFSCLYASAMPLFVEIFRDNDSKNIPIAPIRGGMATVERAIGNRFVVTREDRKLQLASSGGRLMTSSIRWPQLPANISLVVTDKPLYSPLGRKQAGETKQTARVASTIFVGSNALALLSTHEASPQSTSATVARGFGHLFSAVAHSGDRQPTCQTADCIMSDSGEATVALPRELQALFGMLGPDAKPSANSSIPAVSTRFCGECTDHLREDYPKVLGAMAISTLANFNEL